jgi:hypothetical protein
VLTLFFSLLIAQKAPASWLAGFENEGGKEFNTWKGFPSDYQQTYIGHKKSAAVAALTKKEMDPQLWELAPEHNWHNMDGSLAESCTLFDGRKGTVVEGWSVQIDWDWGPTDPKQHGKPGERYGHAPGWTHVSIHARCSKEEVPRIREMYRYLFGLPQSQPR